MFFSIFRKLTLGKKWAELSSWQYLFQINDNKQYFIKLY